MLGKSNKDKILQMMRTTKKDESSKPKDEMIHTENQPSPDPIRGSLTGVATASNNLETIGADSSAKVPDVPTKKKSSITTQRSSNKKPPLSKCIHEYIQFMTRFPKLGQNDRVKLKSQIENELNYELFSELKISDLALTKHSSDKTPILDAMSIRTGVSLNFLHPPVLKCIECNRNLHANHSWSFTGKPPTQVKVHTLTGTKVFSKVSIT